VEILKALTFKGIIVLKGEHSAGKIRFNWIVWTGNKEEVGTEFVKRMVDGTDQWAC
jgi:hypothetical protein